MNSKHVTPHMLRHTLTMDLLHHGVDRSVIALWLGHESVETKELYTRVATKTIRPASTSRDRPPGEFKSLLGETLQS